MGAKRTVIFFQSSLSTVSRRVADGIRRFADQAGWNLHVVPYANAAEREDDSFGNVSDKKSLNALLSKRNPDGCIVLWSPLWPNLPRVLGGIPCATIDNARFSSSVCLDNAAIGRAAAKELLRLKPASCAYLSLQRSEYWCGERIEAFAAAVRESGLDVVDLGGEGDLVNDISERLVAALEALPKPCGIFGANDLVARRVIDAASAAGLAVPHDVAVVGCDDDESVCERPSTTLSSIRPDFEGEGFAAGELLARQMACAATGRISASSVRNAAKVLRIGGVEVVRRLSSRWLLWRDPLVESVLEEIRLRFAEHITAASLAEARGVSLRTLERRFLRVKGRTIGREIEDVRFRAAQRLLAGPKRLRLDAVANFCGYSSDSALHKAFRARLGVTPGKWRKGH